jgi:hypothetical protein
MDDEYYFKYLKPNHDEKTSVFHMKKCYEANQIELEKKNEEIKSISAKLERNELEIKKLDKHNEYLIKKLYGVRQTEERKYKNICVIL